MQHWIPPVLHSAFVSARELAEFRVPEFWPNSPSGVLMTSLKVVYFNLVVCNNDTSLSTMHREVGRGAVGRGAAARGAAGRGLVAQGAGSAVAVRDPPVEASSMLILFTLQRLLASTPLAHHLPAPVATLTKC